MPFRIVEEDIGRFVVHFDRLFALSSERLKGIVGRKGHVPAVGMPHRINTLLPGGELGQIDLRRDSVFNEDGSPVLPTHMEQESVR